MHGSDANKINFIAAFAYINRINLGFEYKYSTDVNSRYPKRWNDGERRRRSSHLQFEHIRGYGQCNYFQRGEHQRNNRPIGIIRLPNHHPICSAHHHHCSLHNLTTEKLHHNRLHRVRRRRNLCYNGIHHCWAIRPASCQHCRQHWQRSHQRWKSDRVRPLRKEDCWIQRAISRGESASNKKSYSI
jgi:hypothetical protein